MILKKRLYYIVSGLLWAFVLVALLGDTAHAAIVPLDLPAGQQKTVWAYITNTKGIITVWRVVLGFVDVVIVGALLIAAFANIFRFKIDTYGVKQALPGIIIGIVLAHLSFFIMRLFIEGSTILTQGIGVFISQYMPEHPIGALPAGQYIVDATKDELWKSLTTFPSDLAGKLSVTGLGVLGLWIVAGSGPGMIAALVLGYIVVQFFPLFMFLILLFLLYIRSYILVVLFMISPLAFFALGFPALKSYWQKWWGTTWKWLLMLPLSMLVLSFAPLFLYYVNRGEGARNLVDYFFFNGVGVAILFFANRIPFMWGSLFGFNAMKEWAKFGSKQSKNVYKGAKFVGDKTGEGIAYGRMLASDPGIGNAYARARGWAPSTWRILPGNKKKREAAMQRGVEDLEKLAKSRGTAIGANATETKDALNSAWRSNLNSTLSSEGMIDGWKKINRDYAKDIENRKKGARNTNLFRWPEAGYAGVKERLKIWEENENKNTKRHMGYTWWGSTPVQKSSTWSRLSDDYKDMQDEKIIAQDIKGLVKQYRDEARKQGKDPGDLLRKLGQKSENPAWTDYDALDPILQQLKEDGFSREDFAKMVRGLNRFQSLVRPQDYKGRSFGGVSVAGDATKPEIVDTYVNNPDMFGFLDVSEASLLDNSAPGQPRVIVSPQALAQERVARAAQGRQALSPDDRDDIALHSQEHIGVASAMVSSSGAALEAKLREVGGDALPPAAAQAIMRTIMSNIYEGILQVPRDTFAGLGQEQLQQILPYVQSYSQSLKGLVNLTDMLSASDRIGIEGEHLKAAINLGVKFDTREAEAALAEAMAKLRSDVFSRDDADNIIETYVRYAPHIRFDKSRSLEDLRKDLIDRSRDLRGMLNILNYEEVQRAQQGYNPNDPNSVPTLQKTVKSAVRVEQMKKETLTQAATDMDRAVAEALKTGDTRQPIEIVTDQKVIERIRPNVERIMEFHPDLRAQTQTLDPAAKAQLANQIARESVVRMAQMKDDNEYTVSMVTRNEPDLRDWLHKALQEGFARMTTPPPSTGA